MILIWVAYSISHYDNRYTKYAADLKVIWLYTFLYLK